MITKQEIKIYTGQEEEWLTKVLNLFEITFITEYCNDSISYTAFRFETDLDTFKTIEYLMFYNYKKNFC